jgi:hypothetical protein
VGDEHHVVASRSIEGHLLMHLTVDDAVAFELA